MGDVARGQRGAMDVGNGCNLCVGVGDRFSHAPAIGQVLVPRVRPSVGLTWGRAMLLADC